MNNLFSPMNCLINVHMPSNSGVCWFCLEFYLSNSCCSVTKGSNFVILDFSPSSIEQNNRLNSVLVLLWGYNHQMNVTVLTNCQESLIGWNYNSMTTFMKKQVLNQMKA